ncbi:MAG: hypothetical protein G01um101430_279 [Parcubacteria group bacterium Gr01-1014_30]|nr:MAG: hypothetical protein G01um101430_279 [Parcubacteria group bacterium Gr01-1014_30]
MIKMILFFVAVVAGVVALFFVVSPRPAEKITWGVNFSHKHARDMGLDWRQTYLAILDDLGANNIKLLTHWDLLEPSKDNYYFDDLDWQIEEVKKRDAKVILVMGMKTGRWPECHLPDWAQSLSKEEQQKEVLELIESVVLRYRDSKAISRWQSENEPFFPFGSCPWSDEDFVKKEIDLIKRLDAQKRPVIVSDTGEFSLWIKPGRLGDVVGTTLYRRVWSKEFGTYVNLPFPPSFYRSKAKFIEKVFGKKVIVVELQAEPWGPKLLYDSPLQEQAKSMNLEQLRKNVEFAQKTGFDEFYLWGAEWWHWMKERQGDSKVWEEVKKLFIKSEL